MKKLVCLLIVLLTFNMARSQFVVEKLWESTVDLPAAAEARQGAGYDGTIYILDKSAKSIYAYKQNGETIEKSTFFTTTAATGVGCAVDDAGNLIMVLGWAGSNPASAIIIKADGSVSQTINFVLPKPEAATNIGRTDFISAFGDIFSEEGGLIYYYSSGQNQANYVKLTNGGISEADITVGSVLSNNMTTGGTGVNVIKGTETSCISHVRTANWQSCNNGEDAANATPTGAKLSTLGGCIFTIKDIFGAEKEIWAYNTGSVNYDSRFKVRNMTDDEDISSLNDPTSFLFQASTDAVNNAATAGNNASCSNWILSSKIDDKTYYIHQYSPNIGIALYKVYDNTPLPTITIPDIVEGSLSFGEVNLGENSQIALKINAENLIEDLMIASDNDAFAISKATIEQKEGKIIEEEIIITYTPTSTTEESATILFSSKGVTYEILVTGIGIEPIPTSPFVVEKLWESTVNIPLIAEARQGNGYDGTIYILDKSVPCVYAYSHNGTEVERSVYYTTTTATGVGNAIDDAGNMVLTVGWAGSNPAKAIIIKAGGGESKTIEFDLPRLGLTAGNIGRTDFISAFGDMFSPKGGLIFYYSNGQTQVNYVKVTNGGAKETDVTVGSITGDNITAGGTGVNVLKGTEDSFIAHVRSNQWQSGKEGEKAVTATPLDAKISTLGGCIFTLTDSKGNKNDIWVYNTGTTNYDSKFKVRDMTIDADIADKDDKETKIFMIGEGTAIATTAVSNWLTASRINDGTYYVHQYHPGYGIALYKVYDPTYVAPPLPSVQLTGFSDDELAFGDVKIGETKELTFTLSAENLVSDISVWTNKEGFTINPSEITPVDGKIENATFTVTYAPTKVAHENAVLTIHAIDYRKEFALSGTPVKIPLIEPVALEATDVTTNSFKAKWEEAKDAENYELFVWKEIPVIDEDFSEITTGNSNSNTGSSSAWTGNDNFPEVTTVYQAGGAIRLGSSSKVGSITTKELDLSKDNGAFVITLDIKGWTNKEGDLKVTCGDESQTISYTALMANDFETKSVNFNNGTATSKITIATTAKRAYIANILISQKDYLSEESIIVKGTEYEVTGLDAATEYQYCVIAKSINAHDSEKSNIITVKTDEIPSLVVNTLVDKIDKKDGLTSLREAVKYAMEDVEIGALRGTDNKYTITFDPSIFTSENCMITLDATLGAITIESNKFEKAKCELVIKGLDNGINIILDGAETTDAGDTGTRIFFIKENNHVTISNMTLQNGYFQGTGAALHNNGILNMINTTIRNNVSYGGGAISNAGELIVINSTFTENRTMIGQTSVLYSTGNATLINTLIINNKLQAEANTGIAEIGDGKITLLNTLHANATTKFVFENVDSEGYPIVGTDGTYAILEGGEATGIGSYVWHNDDYSAIALSSSATTEKEYVKGTTGADLLIDKDQLGITIEGPAAIGARFAMTQHIITASVNDETQGSITPSGAVKVRHGNDQVFTITPNAHYQISSVKVDGVEVKDNLEDGIYTFNNVIGGHVIDVTFAAIEYTITASVNNEDYGTISPSGEVKVAEGDAQAFTITANSGYEIESLLVDGVEAKDDIADGVYTFTSIDANHTIEVIFAVSTGLNQSELDAFTVYYNANSSSAILSSEALQVDVLDLSGQMLGSYHATTQVSLANIPDGVYILRITLIDGTVTRKIMKR